MDKSRTEAAHESVDRGAHSAERRRMLHLMGTAAVAVPVLGLSACGGDSGGDSAAAPMPAKAPEPSMADTAADAAGDAAAAMEDAAEDMTDMAEEAADDMAAKAEDAADAMGEAAEDAAATTGAEAEKAMDTIASDAKSSDKMPKVDENGAQAMGLGYRHDATTVDASQQTRYAAGQQCGNCVLFQGGDAEWGGCPLFAGQVVKRTGWCSAYSAAG